MSEILPNAASPVERVVRSAKAASAFRTISEVAEELDVAQHVLRFWESKFPQVRPLKRGGGRRYYRPEDIVLLRRIRSLLYDEGYTIKGVQKLLRVRRGGTRDDPAPRGEAGTAGQTVAQPLARTVIDAPETAPGAPPGAVASGNRMSAERQRMLAAIYGELCALAEIATAMRESLSPTLSERRYDANHLSARSVAQPG